MNHKFAVGDEVVEARGERVGEVLQLLDHGCRVMWRDGTQQTLYTYELRLARHVGIGDEIERLEEAGEIESEPVGVDLTEFERPFEPAQRWEVVRLVHELCGPDWDEDDNDELAEHLNDGWQVVDISTNTVANQKSLISRDYLHYQIITLRRWVDIDDDLRHDEAEDMFDCAREHYRDSVKSGIDHIRGMLAGLVEGMAMPAAEPDEPIEPLSDDQMRDLLAMIPDVAKDDTQEVDVIQITDQVEVPPGVAGPHAYLTAPDYGAAADAIRRQQRLRNIKDHLRGIDRR